LGAAPGPGDDGAAAAGHRANRGGQLPRGAHPVTAAARRALLQHRALDRAPPRRALSRDGGTGHLRRGRPGGLPAPALALGRALARGPALAGGRRPAVAPSLSPPRVISDATAVAPAPAMAPPSALSRVSDGAIAAGPPGNMGRGSAAQDTSG